MTVSRLIARPMLASMFVVGGLNALKNADALAAKAQPVADRFVPVAQKAVPQAPIPTNAVTLVRLNAVTHIAAGLALATGRAPRLASTVLAASLVPTTLAGHRFWEESDPAAKGNQQVHFFKNVSMMGGLLLAGVDTDGKPGLAWRARRAASDAKREARQLAKDARREARLAKAQLT
ncbi:DoxX family protein [Nocardioides terrigena]|uniref:DoxX family protein n=1 Tax=Nocardioides terrigena TaxID=424797 RepID=UPI000D2FA0D7|nr:DoxX family protein [Nocardioides terrigena]